MPVDVRFVFALARLGTLFGVIRSFIDGAEKAASVAGNGIDLFCICFDDRAALLRQYAIKFLRCVVSDKPIVVMEQLGELESRDVASVSQNISDREQAACELGASRQPAGNYFAKLLSS